MPDVTIIQAQVAGLALIQIAPGVGGVIQNLGYTVDGARMTFEGHSINIPGDENGGDEALPVEIQILGELVRIRLEMNKWRSDIGTLIAARMPSRVAGGIVQTGRLVFANQDYWRLLINSPNDPFNFPCATLVRTPIEINKGTKYSRLVVEWEAYKNPCAGNGADVGVLYNNVIY